MNASVTVSPKDEFIGDCLLFNCKTKVLFPLKKTVSSQKECMRDVLFSGLLRNELSLRMASESEKLRNGLFSIYSDIYNHCIIVNNTILI